MLLQILKKCTEYEAKYVQLSEKFHKATNALEKAKNSLATRATLSKKLKRRDTKVNVMKEKLAQQNKQHIATEKRLRTELNEAKGKVNELEQACGEAQATLEQTQADKRSLQKKACHLKKRSERSTEKKDRLKEELESEIFDLELKVKMAQARIGDLEQLNVLLESDVVKTFEDGKYCDEVRECIMSLITEHNVSLHKVNDVVRVLLQKPTGKLPDCLPSMGVLSRLLVEAKVIAQKQIADEMMKGARPEAGIGNTLHYDATTKFHKHYQSFQVTTVGGKTLSIGMEEVGAGNAEAQLNALKHKLDELSSAVQDVELNPDTFAHLVTSIQYII